MSTKEGEGKGMKIMSLGVLNYNWELCVSPRQERDCLAVHRAVKVGTNPGNQEQSNDVDPRSRALGLPLRPELTPETD